MADFDTPSGLLVTADHVSEGRVLELTSGTWLLVYRIDPGADGDHTGNTGYIACRRSFDDGATWGSAVTVFSDAYDDRNIGVVQVASGRVFVYFRRYDATTSSSIDVNYVYSDDDGATWSSATKMWDALGTYGLPSPAGAFYNGSSYGVPFYAGSAGCCIGWTTDGSTFSWETTNAVAPHVEPAYCVINGGLLGVYRRSDETYLRYNLFDGVSWSDTAVATGVPGANYGKSAPCLVVHPNTGEVICLIGDRAATQPDAANLTSKLWAYRYDGSFTLLDSVLRPVPSTETGYWYPSAIVRDPGLFIVFTERSDDYASSPYEDAWLYSTTLTMPWSPYSVTATLTLTGAQVCWSHDGGADGFVVERQADGGSWTQVYP